MIGKTINIIIADDNSSFIKGLQFILSRSKSYKVIDVCSDGKELIESQQLHNADLVLTDIEMPNMNGIESGKRICFMYPKLPMIALTMHIEKIFLIDIIRAGFKGFIYKPEVPKQLIKVITQVLSNNFVFPENLKIDRNGGLL